MTLLINAPSYEMWNQKRREERRGEERRGEEEVPW